MNGRLSPPPRSEWAPAAIEVIENLPGSTATNYYASEQHGGYQDAQIDAERAIRALAEGDNTNE